MTTEWPERWIDRVRLYRARVKEEAFRVCVMVQAPPRALFEDTSRLGEDIGRFGRLLSNLPIGKPSTGRL